MATKKSKKRKRRIFILGTLSVLVIAGVVYVLSGYWFQIFQKEEEKEFLLKQLVQLKEEENLLKKEADKLQDSDYIARYAREKYLYSKDGEFIIKID